MTTQRPGIPRSRPDRIRSHDEVLPVDPDLAPDDPGEPSSTHRPGRRRRSRQPLVLAAIAAGGFLGALARFEVSEAWPTPAPHFPWATFVINTSGALFLALVLTMLLGRPAAWPYARPLVCVGFTGSWTTMSTFALEADLLAKHGRIGAAALYVAATVVAGLLCAGIGIATGRRLQRR